MRRLPGFFLMPLLLIACAFAARANGQWTFLGQQAVTDGLDHDVIVVTGAEGRFDAIQLRVLRAAVDFHRVVVHFRNGGRQAAELRQTIRAGGASRRIDLTGDDRVIHR